MLYTKEQYQYLRLTLSFRVQLVDWFEKFDSESRGCHRQRGWNQQIMMLKNGDFTIRCILGFYNK